MKLQYIPDYPY